MFSRYKPVVFTLAYPFGAGLSHTAACIAICTKPLNHIFPDFRYGLILTEHAALGQAGPYTGVLWLAGRESFLGHLASLASSLVCSRKLNGDFVHASICDRYRVFFSYCRPAFERLGLGAVQEM